MEDKTIRFIDSNYNDLFTIPNGGSVVVTHANGEQYVGVCKYVDSTHLKVNSAHFHICQFAEMLERNGSKVEPEKEPEMVGSYRITNRIPVGDKVYVMGHSSSAVEPFATWQGYKNTKDKDWGHYWSNRSDAWSDLLCRADAERTGKPYDHTKKFKERNRHDAR